MTTHRDQAMLVPTQRLRSPGLQCISFPDGATGNGSACLEGEPLKTPARTKEPNVCGDLGLPGARPSRTRGSRPRGRAARVAFALAAVCFWAPGLAYAADGAPDESPANGQKVVAFAAGGVGLAGLAGGAVSALLANASWKSAKKECPSVQTCPDHAAAIADHDSAELWATTSTVAFVAGGALVGTAVVLMLTAPPERPRGSDVVAVRVVPQVGAGGAGLVVSGSF